MTESEVQFFVSSQYWTTTEQDLYICPHDSCHDQTHISCLSHWSERKQERKKAASICIICALSWCQCCKFNQNFLISPVHDRSGPKRATAPTTFSLWLRRHVHSINAILFGKGVCQVWEATCQRDKAVHYTLKCTSLSDETLERDCWQISNLTERIAIFNAVKH